MSIPPQQEIYALILDAIDAHGGVITLQNLYKDITKQFPQLTEEDLNRQTPKGANWWQGDIRLALNKLKKMGQVKRLGPGMWGEADIVFKGKVIKRGAAE